MSIDSISEEHVPSGRSSLSLLYHELRPAGSSYSYVLDTDFFAKQLKLFATVRAAESDVLWPTITFDDGHLSNYQYALPLLAEQGMYAHFFITVGWTGVRTGYMGWTEVRELLQAGNVIGAHGWTHKLLTHCNAEELRMELKGARLELEDRLGTAVTTMSLPGGRQNAHVLSSAREAGYKQVFTSVPAVHRQTGEPTVGRLNIRGDVKLEWLDELLRPKSGVLAGIQRQHRVKEAMKAVLGDRTYEKLWGLLNRREEEPSAAEEIAP